MKRIISSITPLILITLISCSRLGSSSLKSITELYDGRISIEKGMRASTSHGKEKYIRLIFEDNRIVAGGWLLPEAMANNCAITYLQENPQTFEDVNVLEIEIDNATSSVFRFVKQDIYRLRPGYLKMEAHLNDFIHTLETNEVDDVREFMKWDSDTNRIKSAAFIKTVKNALPAKHKEIKFIGYREVNEADKTYEVDFIVISLNDERRIVKATLEQTGLRFLSLTI